MPYDISATWSTKVRSGKSEGSRAFVVQLGEQWPEGIVLGTVADQQPIGPFLRNRGDAPRGAPAELRHPRLSDAMWYL
jgi:hypothetical protein